MKISDETIIKFKNGEKLYMPFEMYEELDFKRNGSDMMEETNALLKQILEELKAIRKEVVPTRTKKVTHTANIDGKTITECVTDGIQNALYGKMEEKDE